MPPARSVSNFKITSGRNEDDHTNASGRRLQQRRDHMVIRNEIGIGDQNRSFRPGNSQQVENVILKAPADRGTFDKLQRSSAAGFKPRENTLAAEEVACGLQPALGESGLQITHRRAFDPNVGIAPVVRRYSVPQPIVGEGVATREPDLTIDHQDAPMVAVIVFYELPWKNHLRRLNAAKVFELATGLAHGRGQVVGGIAATLAVEQDIDFNAGLAALSETAREL